MKTVSTAACMSCVLTSLSYASLASAETWHNEFWAVTIRDGAVQELRCDPTGTGKHGDMLLAKDGITVDGGGKIAVALSGAELRLTVEGASVPPIVHWSVPFRRDGYYDADSHRLYGAPDALDSQPHRELFRKFVGATGHARYIEEMKRVKAAMPSAFGSGTTLAPLWLGPSHRMLMCGDREVAFDMDVQWPDAEHVKCVVGDDCVTFCAPLTGVLVIRVEPGGRSRVPGDALEPLQMRFFPDQELTQSLTGKRVSLNTLTSEFMQQALYFYPGVITGGDWLHGAVTTHQLDDPRSLYSQQVRRAIVEAANVGYDRCGHFGLMYCWGRSPNYGDGSLLAPSVDLRHLHINWVFICSTARYALMTRDRTLLGARRVRWLALDDAEPLCGGDAATADPVLVAGDWRIDFLPPTRHTLGQSFTANQPFRAVRLALGNHAGTAAQAVVKLYREGPGGPEMGSSTTALAPHTSRQEVRVALAAEAPPGRYHVELADADSGRKWDGGLCWWTQPAGHYDGGEAYNGTFHGDRWDFLKLLFDYGYEWFGPKLHGVAAYDRAFGCGPNKSGRVGDAIVCVSYWEQFGGGQDLWSSLWYPSACSAMAELARWQGLEADARRYDELRRAADEAFRRTFGREVEENGDHHFRYVACVDWDGVPHDYGHTHYNLEAVSRGIADDQSARRVMTWLDHGALSPDGGATWQNGIYDYWQVTPPFITVNNRDWQGLGGQGGGFPFGEVLAAGGARLSTVLPDLTARARVWGADAVWQRVLQVLDRYARPDRLTGGRVVADPGGRGRWHFGPPQLDRADMEGFREIFPDSGAAAAALPIVFLGLEPTADGLRFTPLVPSPLDGFEVSGLGYGGAVWRVTVRQRRGEDQVATLDIEVEQTFGGADGWSLEVGQPKGAVAPRTDTGHPRAEISLAVGQPVLLRPGPPGGLP